MKILTMPLGARLSTEEALAAPNIAAAAIIRLINSGHRCRTATLALSAAGMMVRCMLRTARAKKIAVPGSDEAYARSKRTQDIVIEIDQDSHVPTADELALLWKMVDDFYTLSRAMPKQVFELAFNETRYYFKCSAAAEAKQDVPLPVRLSAIRIFSGRPIGEEMDNRPDGMSESTFRAKLLLFAQLTQKFGFTYSRPTIETLAETKGSDSLRRTALGLEASIPRVEVADLRASA